MITNDPEEIKTLRRGGEILAAVLAMVAQAVKPGVSASDLNVLAEKEIERMGASPSFKNYQSSPADPPFPAALCVSINEEVVHGLPVQGKILKAGDIVGLDLGVWYRGLATDAAVTVPVGKTDRDSYRLLETTRLCLQNAIEQARPGNTTGDIGHAIEATAISGGFSVVRELVGHGVGKAVHEEPEIPCYGKPGKGVVLEKGMVLAIEPMVNQKAGGIGFSRDGWTITTKDGGRSAHFEHTVLVTEKGAVILTA